MPRPSPQAALPRPPPHSPAAAQLTQPNGASRPRVNRCRIGSSPHWPVRSGREGRLSHIIIYEIKSHALADAAGDIGHHIGHQCLLPCRLLDLRQGQVDQLVDKAAHNLLRLPRVQLIGHAARIVLRTAESASTTTFSALGLLGATTSPARDSGGTTQDKYVTSAGTAGRANPSDR